MTLIKDCEDIMTKKMGFTLSEILITLGIIGIVASMTVPTIISKYSTSEYSARTKKLYGLVSGVFEEAWRDSGVDSVSKLTAQHVERAIANTLRTRPATFERVTYLNDGGTEDPNGTYPARYLLPDGSMFGFYRGFSQFVVYLDCNGRKGPNMYGRDVYRFTVSGSDPTLKPNATNDCTTSGHGYGCAKALMRNGWEIDW